VLTAISQRSLADVIATEQLAATLAGLARVGDVFALEGDLGAGKTVFARAFIRARGCADAEVPSPTFTLVQVYAPAAVGACPIHHFDLYRLEAPEEAYELDIEDAFASAISLIEWPDRLGALLPADSLIVRLLPDVNPDRRRAVLAGPPAWRERLQETGLV
jgi:ATPase, YjeE family